MGANGLLSFHRRRLLHDVRRELLHHIERERAPGSVAVMEVRESVLHLQSLDALEHFCDTHYATLTDRGPSSLRLPESLLRQILTLRDRHVPTRTCELSV
jgi:hypothetical protein